MSENMNDNMRAALALLIDKWQRIADSEEGHPDTEEGHILAARNSGFQIGKDQRARELRQFLDLLN